MSKTAKQNGVLMKVFIALINVCLPFILVFMMAFSLVVLAQKRWTISLCASFLFVGLVLLAKPLIEVLRQKAKTVRTTVNQSKRRVVER